MTNKVHTQYYVQISRRAFGPFSAETIKEMVVQGRIERTSLLSLDKKIWKEAGAISEIFSSETVLDVNENTRQIKTNSSTESPGARLANDNATNKWLVSVDGRECSGSFTTRELFDLLRANKISSEALVWRQGESVSHKLGNNREIQQEFASFQIASDPPGNESCTKEKEKENVRSVDASQEVTLTTKRTKERLTSKIKTRFASTWICLGVTTAATILALILQYRGIQTISLTDFTPGSFVYLFAGLSLTGAVVFGAAFLHAFWSALPQECARANPDEAVAFVFVPGFGIYWIFQALYGGAVDADEALEKYCKTEENGEKNALFVSPGWALATSLFFILGGPFNPVSGFFFLLSLGVTTVQMKNAAIKLDSLNITSSQTSRR